MSSMSVLIDLSSSSSFDFIFFAFFFFFFFFLHFFYRCCFLPLSPRFFSSHWFPTFVLRCSYRFTFRFLRSDWPSFFLFCSLPYLNFGPHSRCDLPFSFLVPTFLHSFFRSTVLSLVSGPVSGLFVAIPRSLRRSLFHVYYVVCVDRTLRYCFARSWFHRFAVIRLRFALVIYVTFCVQLRCDRSFLIGFAVLRSEFLQLLRSVTVYVLRSFARFSYFDLELPPYVWFVDFTLHTFLRFDFLRFLVAFRSILLHSHHVHGLVPRLFVWSIRFAFWFAFSFLGCVGCISPVLSRSFYPGFRFHFSIRFFLRSTFALRSRLSRCWLVIYSRFTTFVLSLFSFDFVWNTISRSFTFVLDRSFRSLPLRCLRWLFCVLPFVFVLLRCSIAISLRWFCLFCFCTHTFVLIPFESDVRLLFLRYFTPRSFCILLLFWFHSLHSVFDSFVRLHSNDHSDSVHVRSVPVVSRFCVIVPTFVMHSWFRSEFVVVVVRFCVFTGLVVRALFTVMCCCCHSVRSHSFSLLLLLHFVQFDSFDLFGCSVLIYIRYCYLPILVACYICCCWLFFVILIWFSPVVWFCVDYGWFIVAFVFFVLEFVARPIPHVALRRSGSLLPFSFVYVLRWFVPRCFALSVVHVLIDFVIFFFFFIYTFDFAFDLFPIPFVLILRSRFVLRSHFLIRYVRSFVHVLFRFCVTVDRSSYHVVAFRFAFYPDLRSRYRFAFLRFPFVLICLFDLFVVLFDSRYLLIQFPTLFSFCWTPTFVLTLRSTVVVLFLPTLLHCSLVISVLWFCFARPVHVVRLSAFPGDVTTFCLFFFIFCTFRWCCCFVVVTLHLLHSVFIPVCIPFTLFVDLILLHSVPDFVVRLRFAHLVPTHSFYFGSPICFHVYAIYYTTYILRSIPVFSRSCFTVRCFTFRSSIVILLFCVVESRYVLFIWSIPHLFVLHCYYLHFVSWLRFWSRFFLFTFLVSHFRFFWLFSFFLLLLGAMFYIVPIPTIRLRIFFCIIPISIDPTVPISVYTVIPVCCSGGPRSVLVPWFDFAFTIHSILPLFVLRLPRLSRPSRFYVLFYVYVRYSRLHFYSVIPRCVVRSIPICCFVDHSFIDIYRCSIPFFHFVLSFVLFRFVFTLFFCLIFVVCWYGDFVCCSLRDSTLRSSFALIPFFSRFTFACSCVPLPGPTLRFRFFCSTFLLFFFVFSFAFLLRSFTRAVHIPTIYSFTVIIPIPNSILMIPTIYISLMVFILLLFDVFICLLVFCFVSFVFILLMTMGIVVVQLLLHCYFVCWSLLLFVLMLHIVVLMIFWWYLLVYTFVLLMVFIWYCYFVVVDIITAFTFISVVWWLFDSVCYVCCSGDFLSICLLFVHYRSFDLRCSHIRFCLRLFCFDLRSHDYVCSTIHPLDRFRSYVHLPTYKFPTYDLGILPTFCWFWIFYDSVLFFFVVRYLHFTLRLFRCSFIWFCLLHFDFVLFRFCWCVCLFVWCLTLLVIRCSPVDIARFRWLSFYRSILICCVTPRSRCFRWFTFLDPVLICSSWFQLIRFFFFSFVWSLRSHVVCSVWFFFFAFRFPEFRFVVCVLFVLMGTFLHSYVCSFILVRCSSVIPHSHVRLHSFVRFVTLISVVP